MKVCPKCSTEKCMTEFGRDASRPDGRYTYCKQCRRNPNRKDREVLELAKAPHSFPFRSHLDVPDFAKSAVSITLLINKESMWIDPINWSAFKEAFHDWSDKNCPNLTITQVIDTRFCERLSPSHSPRSHATGKVNIPNIIISVLLLPTTTRT